MNARPVHGDPATFTWGLFLAVILAAIFVAMGFPMGPLIITAALALLIFSFRSIYFTFYVGAALTPFWGILISASTGDLAFGVRAFGGSIDMSLGEVILFFVLCAWFLKLALLWWKRRDHNWKPQLPAFWAYLGLVGAHLLSVFSRLDPDPILVTKYSLRPVLFDYLAFIALPVNLIRSRRRLRAMLGAYAIVATFAALIGLVSIFFPEGGGLIGHAHSLSIFGVNPLGENHNELANFLVFSVFLTLALAELQKHTSIRQVLYGAAALQFLVGLLTFTRTIWIAFAVQIVVLLCTEWREVVRKHLPKIFIVGLLLLPLTLSMVAHTLSDEARSSNSTRSMLTQIATELFVSSPWIGSGAGTFLDRVGSARIFLIEYGDPLDSHGFIQKIAAETGIIGLVALCIVCFYITRLLWRGARQITVPAFHRVYVLLAVAALGTFVYELFNTEYWTGKMWLPIGIALASIQVLRDGAEDAKNDTIPA